MEFGAGAAVFSYWAAVPSFPVRVRNLKGSMKK